MTTFATQRRLRHLTHLSGFNLHPATIRLPTAAYFTLHDAPHRPAFYVSEKCVDVVNPQWRRFDVSQFKEGTCSSLNYVHVKVWASDDDDDSECLVFSCHVIFGSLNYVGQQIPKGDKNYESKSLVFGMKEGFYTLAGCYKNALNTSSNRLNHELAIDPQMIRSSYSMSTVKRIHMIERAIKQMQVSIWKFRNLIQEQLKRKRVNEQQLLCEEYSRMAVQFLQEELQAQKIQRVIEHDQLLKLQTKVDEKVKMLKNHMEQLKEARAKFQQNYRLFIGKRELLLKTNAELQLRRRRLISELSCIYPISEVSGKGVTICGAFLPNSQNFAGQDERRIAVALGYVLHLVFMIAQFLDVPLRYPVRNIGSRSTIMDHILDKIPDKERELPLFTKGREKLHFNYGVYLLNKNVAQLRYYCGLITHDLGATLPNLLSLLELQQKMKFDFPAAGSLTAGPSWLLPLSSQDGMSLSPKRQQGTEPKPSSCSLPSGSSSISATFNSPLDSLNVHASRFHVSSEVIKRVNSALSCSLDKGLDELHILKRSAENNYPLSGVQLQQTTLPVHGSEPNLVQHQAARTGDGGLGNGAGFFKLPPEMWGTGSSQTTSEDEVQGSDVPARGSFHSLWNDDDSCGKRLSFAQQVRHEKSGQIVTCNSVCVNQQRCSNDVESVSENAALNRTARGNCSNCRADELVVKEIKSDVL